MHRVRHATAALNHIHISLTCPSIRHYTTHDAVKAIAHEPAGRDPLHNAAAIQLLPDETPTPKKRGRKPKAQTLPLTAEPSPTPSEPDAPLKKRRGRPPKTPVLDSLTTPPEPQPTTTPKPKTRTRKPKSTPDDLAITHGSTRHTTLAQFLAHASASNLSKTSTVYRGTHYEYTVAASLSRLRFSLTRVGRTADLGIDLLGHWAVPSLPAPLRILVQCKAEAPKPSMVRELEGAMVGAPARFRGQGTVAVLAAAKEATKGVRDAVGRSGIPMAFLNVGVEGKVRQFVWNQAAVAAGLDGVGVGLRYLPGGEADVVLTWKGLPLPSS